MRTNIPTDLLRSFLAIVDTGSMMRAGEEVYLTQPAISLQMKRLEALLCVTLFNRSGRRLSLTSAGKELAGIARRILELNDQAVAILDNSLARKSIRIGCVQDFADAILKNIFFQIFRRHPELFVEVKVGTSIELLNQFAGGELDIVMYMGDQTEGEEILSLPIRWYGESFLFDQATLPLAVLDRPCGIRDTILKSLDEMERPYRVVVETRSISALRAAVESSIAVTARAGPFLPPHLLAVNPNLTALPNSKCRLRYDPHLAQTAEPLLGMIRQTMKGFETASGC